MKSRSNAARGILLLAALAATGWSYWYYAKQYSEAVTTTHNLDRCQRLAAEIMGARQAPRRAQLTTRSLDDLGSLVEKAAAEAQVERDRILRVDPQPAKRVGKTDYLEQATEVELMAVTLRQLVEFLYAVSTSDNQLEVSTLRLRIPHGPENAASPEIWLADIVLSQRIYSPITHRR